MSNVVQPVGHSAEHQALQEHSVGEHYPLAVVGYGHPTLYVIENLQTGEVLTCGGSPYQSQRSEVLFNILRDFKFFESIDLWVKGRPKFNEFTKNLHMQM